MADEIKVKSSTCSAGKTLSCDIFKKSKQKELYDIMIEMENNIVMYISKICRSGYKYQQLTVKRL